MKVCPNPSCKTENPDRANYCLHCGAGFHVHQADSDAGRFCVECGRPLNRFRSDRRLVTVLFADVHGFTAMSEKLEDPELVTEVMNQCFGMLTTRIVELGGSIDKYMGDANNGGVWRTRCPRRRPRTGSAGGIGDAKRACGF